jgi:hypothetical protein
MTLYGCKFDEIFESIKNKSLDFLNKTALVIDSNFDSVANHDEILNQIKTENAVVVSVNKTSYLYKSEIHIVTRGSDNDNYSYDNIEGYDSSYYKRPIIISNDSSYYNTYHNIKSDIVVETSSHSIDDFNNLMVMEDVEEILVKIGCKNIIILDDTYEISETKKNIYHSKFNVHIFTLNNLSINEAINVINSKTLVVLNNINKDYDVGSLVRYIIKMYYDYDNSVLFLKNGIKIVTTDNIINGLYIPFNNTIVDGNEKLNIFTKYAEKIEKFKKSIYFVIIYRNLLTSPSFLNNKEIKKIFWFNDLHAFAYDVQDRINKNIVVQKYDKKYDIPELDKINYLLTPSMQYFKNLKIDKYNDKVKYLFYALNYKYYEQIDYKDYNTRKNKIILSGCVADGYKTRMQLNQYRETDKKFNILIDKLEHPGYEKNAHMTDMNYYKKLCQYKAAFVGNYVYPINFLLAKHIEVLMCGCLGFFERNHLLKEQLGLIEYVHYIPATDPKGNVISNINYYIYWMESKDSDGNIRGQKIAQTGAEYVREKYGIKYIQEYIDFFNMV